MKYFTILFILLARINYCQSKLIFPLIASYLKGNDIKLCHFFTCLSKSENSKLSQMMSQLNIRCNIVKSITHTKESFQEKHISYFGFILDLSCEEFHNFALTEVNQNNFRMSRPWLLITKESNFSVDHWQTIFKDVKVRMDSDVKLAVPQRNGKNFIILDVYNPGFHLGGKPIITEVGFWNGSDLRMSEISFYSQRKNMSSIRLRTGSVVLVDNHSGTFEEYMLDPRYKHLDTMSKFHYSMFLLLEEVHNFTHTLQIEDKWFGNYQNGTDEGVGRLLYEEKIDITCTGASQRPPRMDAYDYLMPSYHFRPCYVFRNPGSYDPFSNQFLKPFSSKVWYIIILTGALISLFLKICRRIEGWLVGLKLRYSWATAVLITASTILQQGSYLFPTGHGGRVVFVVLLLLSNLLYDYYTSSIISSLLSKPPTSFRTLDELGHSKLEIGIEDLPYTITWFEIINDSDVQYIYKKKVYPPGAKNLNIYTAEEGIAKVRQGGFAYHTQLDTGYPIIARTFGQDAICDVAEIPMIPQVFAGIMAQKNSQYKELFHVTLRKTRQAGLIQRFTEIWESKKPQCLSSARVIAVGADQTFVAFLALLIGMGLSLFLLTLEIVWFKFDLDHRY